VADEYFEAKIGRKSAKYRKTTMVQLKNYVHATIGEMPIQKVDCNTILEKGGLRELWTQKNPTATDVMMHLDRMFRLAIHNKYYGGENPASWEALQHILPASADVHREKHREALPYKDAGRFMRDLRAYDDRSWRKQGHTTAAFLLEFVVL